MNTTSTMVLSEIQSHIRGIEEDTSLCKETNFDSRADAIDFIDFHIIDRIEGLQQNTELDTLKQHAEQVKSGLEKIDASLFKQLRQRISAGSYTRTYFREMVCEYTGYDVSDTDESVKAGYDNLDVFINGLLSGDTVPGASVEPEPEMVFYQKTPARIVFQLAMLAQLNPNDVFFDIGSGLGQAAILINLLSGAKAVGIEYEPVYCHYARACASQLNLSNVEFINTDARKADYSRATTFFMYTPFEGSMLQDMLKILQTEARKRPVSIFTYGPCSPYVALQSWLNCLNGTAGDHHKLYEFRSRGA